jgi:hypothetical protein
MATLHDPMSFKWPESLIWSTNAFSLGRVSIVISWEKDEGIGVVITVGRTGAAWRRCSRGRVIGVADCSKAASNDLFIVETGCGVLTIAQRAFGARPCPTRAVRMPFGECAGGCGIAGGAFVASCKRTFGAESPAGVGTTGRAGGDESSEALLLPGPIIHPRCVAPRKCWVVEFDDMR